MLGQSLPRWFLLELNFVIDFEFPVTDTCLKQRISSRLKLVGIFNLLRFNIYAAGEMEAKSSAPQATGNKIFLMMEIERLTMYTPACPNRYVQKRYKYELTRAKSILNTHMSLAHDGEASYTDRSVYTMCWTIVPNRTNVSKQKRIGLFLRDQKPKAGASKKMLGLEKTP